VIIPDVNYSLGVLNVSIREYTCCSGG